MLFDDKMILRAGRLLLARLQTRRVAGLIMGGTLWAATALSPITAHAIISFDRRGKAEWGDLGWQLSSGPHSKFTLLSEVHYKPSVFLFRPARGFLVRQSR